MSIVRTTNTLKHMRHRTLHSGVPFSHALNALAGGANAALVRKGVRLSGFQVTEYYPVGHALGPKLVFNLGAFIQASSSGDYRGLIAEEKASITVNGADVAAGVELTLWGWVNNADVSGVDVNAYYKVTATVSPPISHAVPLAHTKMGDEPGAFHWVPDGGASLLDQSDRIDSIISSGGTTRDFVHVAMNYHAAHPEYLFMTFQDFGSDNGELGTWTPTGGDESKFDTDNRQLKRGVTVTDSLPFDADAFEISDSPGTYYELSSARAIWMCQRYSGDVLLPEPVLDATVSIRNQGGDELITISGPTDYDTDVPIDPVFAPFSLAAPNHMVVRIVPATPADDLFLRCIVLFRVGEP